MIEYHFLGSEKDRQRIIDMIKSAPVDGSYRVTLSNDPMDLPKKMRTPKQNNCLHEWLGDLASALNDAGIPFGQLVIRLPRRFTKENLKELVVRPMLNALWPEKKSTTELTTLEMQDLYRDVDQVVAERTGVHVEWPDRWNK